MGFANGLEHDQGARVTWGRRPGLMPPLATTAKSHNDTSGGTINALIANAGWAEKKPTAGTGQATAQVDSGPQQPHEEMLSPDLVFTAKDKEKETDGER